METYGRIASAYFEADAIYKRVAAPTLSGFTSAASAVFVSLRGLPVLRIPILNAKGVFKTCFPAARIVAYSVANGCLKDENALKRDKVTSIPGVREQFCTLGGLLQRGAS